jgi:hypothetical protein
MADTAPQQQRRVITVYCDDSHHARGKICKIETFEYYADTGSWVGISYKGRAYRHPGEYPTPFRPNVVGSRPPLRHRYECKLCAGRLWVPRWNAPTKHCCGC